MISEVSSLTSPLSRSPFLTSNPRSTTISPPGHGFRRRPTSIKATSIDISSQKPLQTARPIGTQEPPWLLLPPPAPQNPFSGEAQLFDFQLKGSGAEIPFSIRFVQMRKKNLALRRPSTSTEFGSVGNAVWSLSCMIEELQQSVLSADDDGAVARVSRDTADSVVWLFKRVFFTSPNLMVRLLVLTSEFIVLSTEKAVSMVTTDELWQSEPPKMGTFGCWSDVGILDQAESQGLDNSRCFDYKQQQMVYEQIIVTEKASSLILSNYAQLLYQYEEDLDRANDYFRRAVRVEPVDGEARSKYALFLWQARGDVEQAEEMFLEAIEVEPESVYHRSNYAWFLLSTGGLDTCYPLDCNGDDDDDK